MPLLATLALVLTACATGSGSPGRGWTTPDLAGTHWVVTSIDGKAPVRGPELVADFGADGRVSGDAGCNSFSGPYIQTGLKVSFGELLSTRRACVEADRQQQETRLLAIMQGETTVRLQSDRLSLRGKSGSLVLTKSESSVIGYQR
jgi:heat shock protein HslJ